MAILISDKINLKNVTRDKKDIFIRIKKPIHQAKITVGSIHAPNNIAPKCINQKLEKLNNSTIIVRYYHTPLSIMNRTTI